MKIKYLLFALPFVLFACSWSTSFVVEGVVADADGKTLYLDYTGLLKTECLDSVKLKANGKYHFKAKSPQYPDFYRLRLENKTINFAVDSTEHLTINADSKSFSSEYIIEGSDNNNNIKELRQSLSLIQSKVNKVTPQSSANERNAIWAEVEADVLVHKDLAKKIILANPGSTAAYYAIYQKIGNSYLFSPYAKDDKPYCSAVATSFNAFMPDYERTKNIYGLVMDAIKAERQEKEGQAWREILEKEGKGYIEIELPDNHGNIRKLSALEGKVILIDFSAYQLENSVHYTFELRELYNKYKAKGFEIYQVSLDKSKFFWEESVANIPWICVRDENAPDCVAAATYNVQRIPTIFLLNKKGDIVLRTVDFKELDKAIGKLTGE